MNVYIHYHPSPPQKRFHETDSDEVFYGGEVAGGKTTAIVMDALIKSLQHKGVTPYIFRSTYQQGEDSIVKEMEKQYPKDGVLGRYNKETMAYQVINSSEIRVRQCKTLSDAEKNDSKEFSVLYGDEAEHWPYAVFDYLATRVRANRALRIKPQIKLGGMQGGIGHAWIKREFINKLDPNVPTTTTVHSDKTGEDYEVTREFIPAAITDNKHVDEKYAARMEQRSEKLKKRLLSNEWKILEGQAFPEWVDKPYDKNGKKTDRWTHVVEDFPIPAHWPIIRGYDHGRSDPYSVLWFAQSDDMYNNRLFLIYELYGGTEDDEGLDETVSEIALKIARFEAPLLEEHGYIEGIADPAIFGKNWFDDETVASVMARPEYSEKGVLIRAPIEFRDPRADPEVAYNVVNNRLQGLEMIKEALMFNAEGIPGFQVLTRCKHFRRHIPNLVRDPKNPDDVESKNQPDHDYDAWRLVVKVKRPIAIKPIVKQCRPRYDPLDSGKRVIDDGDMGRVIQIPDIIIGGMK